MAKRQSAKTMTPEQVAQKAKPNFKAVTYTASDARPGVKPDAAVPGLDALHQKYFGKAPSRAASEAKAGASEVQMVVMEPKTSTDAPFGRKRMLVDKGKLIGEQG